MPLLSLIWVYPEIQWHAGNHLVGSVTDYVLGRFKQKGCWALESSPQGEGCHDLSWGIRGTVRTEWDLLDVPASLD